MPTKSSDWKIDEASKESFPASDPPAWGSSRAAPSRATAAEGLEDLEAPAKTRSLRTPILIGVIGAIAITGIVFGVRFLKNR